ncbi:MAG: response regulator [Gammaproteobacteria bacterium]|nr:response regulator [Gammaproteobacteria bacterium]
MLNKTALIVDDSRTAGQILRLMLEREEFQVDVLGNAEAAIGYLRDHRPGIIFMDHLMPGMDGFQAVKEIKSTVATSTIPIVMYTAKSGELYVGQAHALGAVDILPKPPTRETLRAVFRRIDERVEAANEPAPEPVVEIVARAPAQPPALEAVVVADDVEFAAADVAHPHNAERGTVVPAPGPDFLRDVTGESEDTGSSWQRVSWWLAAAAAAASFVLGTQFSARESADSPYLRTLSWALSESFRYPYEEAPFAGERVERIRTLVEHLAQAGFKGTLRLEGNAGQFCLVAASGGWRVADAALPIESCEMIGLSPQEARQASGRQSAEFRELLQKLPLLAGPDIRLEIEALGDRNPYRPYPPHDQVASAGDWNRIAAENNRITVSVTPRS